MIHISEPQRQQIMQTKEFADKFNELTEGWKPSDESRPDSDVFNAVRRHMIQNLSFIETGLDWASYEEVQYCYIHQLEWGLLHKICHYALSLKPSEGIPYEPFYKLYKEISDFIAKQREESVKSVFLQLKAKNSLIK